MDTLQQCFAVLSLLDNQGAGKVAPGLLALEMLNYVPGSEKI
jgi:hypothetical protein